MCSPSSGGLVYRHVGDIEFWKHLDGFKVLASSREGVC